MPLILSALFGFLGSGIKGFLGWKEAQADTVKSALAVVSSIDDNDAQSVTATANALQVILTQGSFLERNWRAWLMVGLMTILFASFFGYVPPHFNDALTPMMSQVFELLKLGLGGYIVRRGIVDVVRLFNIGSILKTLINKKLS